VRVRIRARDVALALEAPPATTFRNIVRGRIEEIATGDGAMAEVRLDTGGAAIVARVTRLSVAELGLQKGMTCYALIKAIALDRHSVGYA
jgi:molybdate transport system ATP-binding protein